MKEGDRAREISAYSGEFLMSGDQLRIIQPPAGRLYPVAAIELSYVKEDVLGVG